MFVGKISMKVCDVQQLFLTVKSLPVDDDTGDMKKKTSGAIKRIGCL